MSTNDPTPPALPPEVREAIATTARALFGVGSDRDNFVAVTTEEMEAALAPLWPRPALDVDAVLSEYVSDPKDDGSYTLSLNAEETTKLRADLLRLVARPVPVTARIKPDHAAADAFWAYWRENGETHKHGYYESTWGAINAALAVAGQASTPAPVTADARELVERIHKAVFAAESYYDEEVAAIAAVLAPVLAGLAHWKSEAASWEQQADERTKDANEFGRRAEAAEAKLAAIEEDGTKEHNAAVELRSQLAARIKESEARVDNAVKMLEAVTRERDQLRAEVETLLWNLAGCDTIASGHSKPSEFNADMARPALHAVSRLRQERDDLRAEVAEHAADKKRFADACRQELADLRAQLAEAQQKGEDWFRDWERAAEKAKTYAAQLAAAQADTERLDWLANQGVCWRDCNKHDPAWVVGPGTEWAYRPECVRSAIDAARREGGAHD